jgi:hypothetical protein
MKELNLIAAIAGGILLGAALLPMAPIVVIVVGSQILGRALQERYHVPEAKIIGYYSDTTEASEAHSPRTLTFRRPTRNSYDSSRRTQQPINSTYQWTSSTAGGNHDPGASI